MQANIQAEILNIGDELLNGQVLNTNASAIATMLNRKSTSVIAGVLFYFRMLADNCGGQLGQLDSCFLHGRSSRLNVQSSREEVQQKIH